MTFDQAVQAAKWLMGALAVVGSFLLIQGEVVLDPIVKLIIGVVLVLAAYVNPETVAAKVVSRPAP